MNDDRSASSFGRAVALDGDTALIGAPGEVKENNAAYLFYRKDRRWSKGLKLTPYPRRLWYEHFGISVALCKDTAIVGKPGTKCDDGDNCGEAHIFTGVGSDNLKASPDEPFIASGVEGYMDQ